MITGRAIAAILLYCVSCTAGENIPTGYESIATAAPDDNEAMVIRGLYGRNRGQMILPEEGYEYARYDCDSDDPCRQGDAHDDGDYDLVPLPGCRRYALCRDGRSVNTFDCPYGKAFDHRLKTCLDEEVALCHCRGTASSSSSSSSYDRGPSSSTRSWFDIRGDVTEYVWIMDDGHRTPSDGMKMNDDGVHVRHGERTKSGKAFDYQIGSKSGGKMTTIDIISKSSKGGKAGGHTTTDDDDGRYHDGVIARSSKGGKSNNIAIAKSHKVGKSTVSGDGHHHHHDDDDDDDDYDYDDAHHSSSSSSSWDAIVPPCTEMPTSEPSATGDAIVPSSAHPTSATLLPSYVPTVALPLVTTEPTATRTNGPMTAPPSVIVMSDSPTIALPLVTIEPSATRTNGPMTASPSVILRSDSPTIALPLVTAEPTATRTNGPMTALPSVIVASDSPTIALPLVTTEPTAAKTIGPNTIPSVLPSSDGPTIASTLTTTPPSQQPSSEECISGSDSETFDGGVFPVPPWTTGGDGFWTVHDGITWEGKYSIKSPDLTVAGATSIAVANATVSTCVTYLGGTMSISVLAGGILPPTDVFGLYVDGVEARQLIE